ncbi:MAG: ABC transporter permease [Bdellovibrionia bacterium]
MKEISFLAWRNLFRNPRRTLASLITVAFGAAGLLIYQGFNNGIMNQYRENTIHGYYGYGQVMPKNYYGKVRENPWEKWLNEPQTTEQFLKSIPQIKEVFPRVTLFSFLVNKGITLAGKGEGVLPERENSFFNQMNFIQGNNLQNEFDIILGKGLAESLNVKIGDTVTLLTQTINGQLNGADLQVVGVFHMGQKSIDDTFFRVHLKQAQSLLDTQKVELFSLATTGVSDWKKIADQISNSPQDIEAIPFEVLDKTYYQNSVDFLDAQFSFIRTIILLIVALGIFNTIAVGLLERAGEIGALRANGEKKSRLTKIFLFESALLGVIGGILGIILALVVDVTLLSRGIPMPPGPGITRQFLIYLEHSPAHFLQALLLPTLATVIASLLPIRNLLKRSIPDLLRSTP